MKKIEENLEVFFCQDCAKYVESELEPPCKSTLTLYMGGVRYGKGYVKCRKFKGKRTNESTCDFFKSF